MYSSGVFYILRIVLVSIVHGITLSILARGGNHSRQTVAIAMTMLVLVIALIGSIFVMVAPSILDHISWTAYMMLLVMGGIFCFVSSGSSLTERLFVYIMYVAEFMLSVGYDMYLQLLEEAVLEERGERKPVVTECSADLTLSANIPESYVPSPEQRMDLYRRIAAIRSEEDADDLVDELIDRYGEPPKSVQTLLDVALLRSAASAVGITDITQRKDALRFTLTVLEVERVVKVCGLGKYRQRLVLSAGETPAVTLTLRPGQDSLQAALELVEDLKLQG